MKLTEEQERDYLEKPEHCPVCGSDDLDKKFDFSPETNEKLVECSSCSSRWVEHYQLVAISNVRRGEYDEADDIEADTRVLTAELLRNMQDGEVFASGKFINSPEGIYMSMRRPEDEMMWQAVRGTGFHDWAIYANWASDGWDEVLRSGEKITNYSNIKKLVECDEDAFNLYRC